MQVCTKWTSCWNDELISGSIKCCTLVMPSASMYYLCEIIQLQSTADSQLWTGSILCLFQSSSNLFRLLFKRDNLQRSYCHNIGNSTIIAMGALGLFTAGGCMHMLKRMGKQPHQDWHKLWFRNLWSIRFLCELRIIGIMQMLKFKEEMNTSYS